ncbi:hypothetical protein SAMN06297382_2350 [Amphiplicatus metriothermophilus]|uniref:Uncharacterized protein n=1 Tax=Amphiplicatus metriothermophilus TaxID=1519374 RepID=A0A239PYM1_9PROT|nr:hypothetical protein [Amphiplicatus metriothermophilus]MBB5519072.1 hypothetical protein [Amphiplicatus metriothermophilus]SNT74767.1 hypothetical protein SAMN06297382_2350 [Amphiplicatus metriothermophilus]
MQRGALRPGGFDLNLVYAERMERLKVGPGGCLVHLYRGGRAFGVVVNDDASRNLLRILLGAVGKFN